MKKTVKRLLSIVLSIMLILGATGVQAFAADATDTDNVTLNTVELTSEGIVQVTDDEGDPLDPSPLIESSISGFKQATLNEDPAFVFVVTNATWFGGMGITVKTFSSWSGYMSMDVVTSDGDLPLSGRAVYSNGEVQYHDLVHYSPSFMIFKFSGIPSDQSVFVQIWVYG